MSSSTLVWIDHHEARIFDVAGGKTEPTVVAAPKHHIHRHPRAASAEHNHPSDTTHFFQDVADALEGAGHVLLVGPSTAKLQFLKYVSKQHAGLDAKVVGIETVDHPTDGQLLAQARRYFGVPSPRLP